MRPSPTAAVGLILAGSITAQTYHDVPAAGPVALAPNGEGNSVAFFDPAASRSRQQVLVGAAHVNAIQNRMIREIVLRRDGVQSQSLSPVDVDVEVWISTTGTNPESASPSFARNHALSPKLVLSGTVRLPQSPAVAPDRWAQDQTIRMPFSTPYAYASGNLCLEFRGGASASSAPGYWPIDAVRVDHNGSVTDYGNTCAGFAPNPADPTLRASAESMLVGGSVYFLCYGRANTPGALVLGPPLPSSVDLTPIGMTGCVLHVDPLLMVSQTFVKPFPNRPAGSAFYSLADVHVPYDIAFVGGNVRAQLVNVETGPERSNPLGVTLSQALSLTFGSTVTVLGMSMVETRTVASGVPFPEEGRVVTNLAPVIRFVL